MAKKKPAPEDLARKIEDRMDPWILEHADALDYPDAGDPTRETGIPISPRIAKLIEERRRKRSEPNGK